jgi:hypothetical protein
MIAIILALGVGCQADPPGNTLARYCLTIDEQKVEMDQAFSPLRFSGTINEFVEVEYPGKHFVYEARLNLEHSPQDQFSEYACEDFHVNGSDSSFVGFGARMKGHLAIGDRVVKLSGTHKFFVIDPKGDTLMTELESQGWCLGNDCSYQREGNQLCVYR